MADLINPFSFAQNPQGAFNSASAQAQQIQQDARAQEIANKSRQGWDVGRGLAAAFTGGLSEAALGIAGANDPKNAIDWNKLGQQRVAQQDNWAQNGALNSAIGANGSGNVVGGANGNWSPGGPTQANTPINTGGLAGFFGQEKDYPVFAPGVLQDGTDAGNRQIAYDQMSRVMGLPTQTMQGAQMQGAQMQMGPQEQYRAKQMALAGMLNQQAMGQGPSAAQAQLQMGSDRAMQQAMALGASYRGGNALAGMRQAQFQRADIAQNATAQSAMLRAQEQQAAQQALSNHLASGRGQDIGLSQAQAGFTQQANQVNAGMQQDANMANLQAGIQQQGQRESLVQQYLQMGMTLDQANYQANVQQNQYQYGLIAQQMAAANNVSVQNAAQGMQIGGAAIGAVGAGVTGGTAALGGYLANKAANGGK